MRLHDVPPDFPFYSRYRDDLLIREQSEVLRVEHELNQERGQFITNDDILNLRIWLETGLEVS